MTNFNTLTLWDQVVIISFLRLYRLIDFPALIDLSTITTPLRLEVHVTVGAISVEITHMWTRLMDGFTFINLDYCEAFDHGTSFVPGAFGLSG